MASPYQQPSIHGNLVSTFTIGCYGTLTSLSEGTGESERSRSEEQFVYAVWGLYSNEVTEERTRKKEEKRKQQKTKTTKQLNRHWYAFPRALSFHATPFQPDFKLTSDKILNASLYASNNALTLPLSVTSDSSSCNSSENNSGLYNVETSLSWT